MSESRLTEDAKEKILSEPLPDEESEEIAESEETLKPEELVEPVEPEKTIETKEPAEPEETAEPQETLQPEDPSLIQEDVDSRSESLNLSKSQQEENPSEPLPDVHTAAEPGQPAESEETVESEETPPIQVVTSPTNAELSIEDLEEEASTLVHISESFSRTSHYDDKFTQTFFKYMKDLSDRRCVEIFNTYVDYEDKSLLFYRKSSELLQFVDVERSRI